MVSLNYKDGLPNDNDSPPLNGNDGLPNDSGPYASFVGFLSKISDASSFALSLPNEHTFTSSAPSLFSFLYDSTISFSYISTFCAITSIKDI